MFDCIGGYSIDHGTWLMDYSASKMIYLFFPLALKACKILCSFYTRPANYEIVSFTMQRPDYPRDASD
jgi:hypothetical protein